MERNAGEAGAGKVAGSGQCCILEDHIKFHPLTAQVLISKESREQHEDATRIDIELGGRLGSEVVISQPAFAGIPA